MRADALSMGERSAQFAQSIERVASIAAAQPEGVLFARGQHLAPRERPLVVAQAKKHLD